MARRYVYREISPKPYGILPQKLYVATMLWFVGRAVQAGAMVDPDIQEEFKRLPKGFTFSLGVLPEGPNMIVGKDRSGNVRYLGGKLEGKKIDLLMKIKNIEAAVLMFSFQESTPEVTCNDRLIVNGEVAPACAVVRILDAVQVYLLPKLLARLAVKRYPSWGLTRKLTGRAKIYWGALFARQQRQGSKT